jgi:copper homeostasis protein (lipoprotein)
MSKTFARRMFLFVPVALLLALGNSTAVGQVIKGTALYKERIALPPEAVFEATLEDITRADAPAEVLGKARLEPAGQPPLRFEITYDRNRIQPGHSYVVRARVTHEGRLLYTSDRIYPVLTRGHGNSVDTLLRSVSAKRESLKSSGSPLGELPSTFAGQLPCADCEGIRWHLDLLPDQTFQLRLTYLGKPQEQSVDEIGRWKVVGDRRVLRLVGGSETRESFEILDTKTLRKLDKEGKSIESTLNYELKRSQVFAPIEPKLALTGMYLYLADAGLITVCAMGWKLPVATEGDNAALETACTKARRKPGEPLLVSLEGRIVQRQPMEGPGPRPTVVVDRFEGVWPGETCSPPFSTAELRDTSWKLTRLNGAPVAVGFKQREPHIVLHSKEQRFAGSGGCNRIMSSYKLDGEKLSFGKMAMTKMACPEGMEQEKEFVATLQRVRRWKITGQHLDLFDEAGKKVARLQAAYLRH